MSAGVLLILDGWGIGPPGPDNAIAAARTPRLDELCATYPTHTVHASGRAVGLPEGVVGNSEIGHLVIGAGRPLDYDSLLVEREVSSGRLRTHPVLAELCGRLRARGATLHLIGLVSDGRIHSDIAHLAELLHAAAKGGMDRVAIHAITDGRDVPNGTAGDYLGRLADMARDAGVGTVVSIVGRNYAMDKSGQVALTERACALIVDGVADLYVGDVREALEQHKEQDDGWLPPIAIGRHTVGDGDAVLFVNFRSDRTAPLADMIAARLGETGRDVRLLSLAQYDTRHPIEPLVPRADASGGLADALDDNGIRSLRVAEPEKFEHVTFFINGRDGTKRPLEEHVCVRGESPPDYRAAPQMNVARVAQVVAEATRRPEVGLIVANLSNIDVVGHTGDYAATVRAAEAVDQAVGVIADAALTNDRWLIVVGDHGNGERMTQSGRPYGGHTDNPVPAVVTVPGKTGREGTLADIAPTALTLLGCPVPARMTGRPLL